MRTTSYISAVALAAALITSPQIANAQGLGVDLGGLGVDASVEIGGDSLVDVDAGVNVGGDNGLGVDTSVDVGGSGADDSLVDVDASVGSGTQSSTGSDNSLVDVDLDVGTSSSSNSSSGSTTGPNGGTLIDLNANVGGGTVLDTNVEVLGGQSTSPTTSPPTTPQPSSNQLITGDIRIGAIGNSDARTQALLDLIASPNLAEIDLDAAIDDKRVSILAAADILGPDALAEIELAIGADSAGRGELLDALAESTELGSILGNQGIDLDDVLAVQIAENGATEVIVLDNVVRVALGGDNGDFANLQVGDTAELDVDLLSEEELAAIDLDVLPDDQRAEVQLRLLSDGGNLADLTVDELANIDLDLLSDDELASLDLDLLPETLRTPIELRLLGEDGDLVNLDVGDLAELDVGLQPSGSTPGTGGDVDEDPDGSGTGGDTGSGSDDGSGNDNDAGSGDDGASGGEDQPGGDGAGSGGEDSGDGAGQGSGGGSGSADGTSNGDANGGSTNNASNTAGGVKAQPNQLTGGSGIATLDCDIGVLALAKGIEATEQTIAAAQSLELVRIEGCERQLVDAEVSAVRDAIQDNPAIASALEGANVSPDAIAGATVQGGILTLFIDPVNA